MIHQKSYQVSQEFYDEFLVDEKNNVRFFMKDKEPQKYLFDLMGFVEDKLRQVGIAEIYNENIDTYENYQKFASYRKACHNDEESGGRNISIVMIG